MRIARQAGVSGYLGDGANRWPAVHTLDLAVLYRLALENAPAGAQLLGAAEPGIPVRDIAAAIGRRMGLPTASRTAEDFASFAFIGMDVVIPSDTTRELLGWEPTHPDLIDDIEQNYEIPLDDING